MMLCSCSSLAHTSVSSLNRNALFHMACLPCTILHPLVPCEMLTNSFSQLSFHMQCCILPMLPSLIPYAMLYIPNHTPILHMPCCIILMPPNLIQCTMLFPLLQHIVQYKMLYISHTAPSHSTCQDVCSLFPLPYSIYHAVYSLFSNTSFNLPC